MAKPKPFTIEEFVHHVSRGIGAAATGSSSSCGGDGCDSCV
jgi:hypothetical protein